MSEVRLPLPKVWRTSDTSETQAKMRAAKEEVLYHTGRVQAFAKAVENASARLIDDQEELLKDVARGGAGGKDQWKPPSQ